MLRIALTLLFLPLPLAAGPLTAARMLPAGTVLAAEDFAATTSATTAKPADLIGKQLRLTVYEGRPVTASHVTTPTLITRNQVITLTYEQAALRIETEGRALAAGGAGDLIRVMNLSSRATLTARVNPDGTATVAQR